MKNQMRLSLKRAIIISYLVLCAILSFVNYRYSPALYPEEDPNSLSDASGEKLPKPASPHTNPQSHAYNYQQRLFTLLADISFSHLYELIWPNETVNFTDRILEQMRFAGVPLDMDPNPNPDPTFERDHFSGHPKNLQFHKYFSKESTQQTIYVFLPNGLSAWGVPGGRVEFQRQQCALKNCYLTEDQQQQQTSQAILFRNQIIGNYERTFPEQLWIFYTLESPENTATLEKYADQVNWTATYRLDSDIVTPYEKFVAFSNLPTTTATGQSAQKTDYASGKSKYVAWFVSNCLTTNNRQGYAFELAKYIQVDIYGSCGPLKCSRLDDKCQRVLDTDYRFYLAFENSNCRDYISEKFFVNGLQHDVIPIVMGAPRSDYERVAPPHSFIHVEDFESPAALADYLHTLSKNDTMYNEYFKWKNTGRFVNTKFWCRLCAMLNMPKAKSYEDLEMWWRSPSICSPGWKPHSTSPSVSKNSATHASLSSSPKSE